MQLRIIDNFTFSLQHSQSKIDGNVDLIKKTLQGSKLRKKENDNIHDQEPSTNGEDKYFLLPEDEKERHSSGESVDSFYSEASLPESDSELRNEETGEFGEICVKNEGQTLQADALQIDSNTAKPIKHMQNPSDFESEETNKEKGQPRGILKRCVRRCFSESHATSQVTMDNFAWSNSIFDSISDPIPENSLSSASSEDSKMEDDGVANKKFVRLLDVVLF